MRAGVVGAAAAAAVLSGPGVAAAAVGGSEPAACFVADAQGQLPICTRAADGRWTVSARLAAGAVGAHTFSVVVVLALVAAGIGIVVTVVRTVVARRDAARTAAAGGRAVAARSGTPSESVPAGTAAPAAPAPPPAPAAARLVELQGLLDAGLVTETEYRARRAAIIDSV